MRPPTSASSTTRVSWSAWAKRSATAGSSRGSGPKKRDRAVAGARRSWNSMSAGASAGWIGRTWAMPPSTSTTSEAQCAVVTTNRGWPPGGRSRQGRTSTAAGRGATRGRSPPARSDGGPLLRGAGLLGLPAGGLAALVAADGPDVVLEPRVVLLDRDGPEGPAGEAGAGLDHGLVGQRVERRHEMTEIAE